jgi:hypothetical protein
MKLTDHLYLVQRFRMRGAIHPLPQYVFMVWCSVKRYEFTKRCLVKHRDKFTFPLPNFKFVSIIVLLSMKLNSYEWNGLKQSDLRNHINNNSEKRKTGSYIYSRKICKDNGSGEIIWNEWKRLPFTFGFPLQNERLRDLGRPKRRWRDQHYLRVQRNTL